MQLVVVNDMPLLAPVKDYGKCRDMQLLHEQCIDRTNLSKNAVKEEPTLQMFPATSFYK